MSASGRQAGKETRPLLVPVMTGNLTDCFPAASILSKWLGKQKEGKNKRTRKEGKKEGRKKGFFFKGRKDRKKKG